MISIDDRTLRLVSAVVGRDLVKDRESLQELRLSVGGALSEEDQKWVSKNLLALAEFFRTEEGKIALQTLVGDWRASKSTSELR